MITRVSIVVHAAPDHETPAQPAVPTAARKAAGTAPATTHDAPGKADDGQAANWPAPVSSPQDKA